MNKAELREALELARSDAAIGDSLDVFDGFGLPSFKPVTCTIRQVARLIRWQAVCLDGNLDGEAFNEVARCGRRKFIIVG